MNKQQQGVIIVLVIAVLLLALLVFKGLSTEPSASPSANPTVKMPKTTTTPTPSPKMEKDDSMMIEDDAMELPDTGTLEDLLKDENDATLGGIEDLGTDIDELDLTDELNDMSNDYQQ